MFRRNWAKLLRIPLLLLLSLLVSMIIKDDSVRVRGYYRKDETYVRPHYRTAPEILSLTIGPSMAATIGSIARFLLKVILK